MEGRARSFSRRMEGQDSSYSRLYEENSIFFRFMQICQCTKVLAENMRVHAGIALKVAYTHKQVFLGDFLWTSKYNMSKGGPRSLQRDMGIHKDVIYQVW